MILLAALIGVGIGIVVGALGAGGGILSVPVLVYLLGMAPHDATGASLVIVGVTALVALRHPAKSGNVSWKDGFTFGACAIVFAATASRLSMLIPERTLMLAFAALLLAVSILMFVRAQRTRADENRKAVVDEHEVLDGGEDLAEEVLRRPSRGRRILSIVLAAAVTGCLTGLFGVGGGFLAVPMLVMALKLPIRVAAGTSLIVMAMSSASALLARIGTPTHVDWVAVLLFTAGSALGGALGGPLTKNVRPSTLTAAFASLLLVIGVSTGVSHLW